MSLRDVRGAYKVSFLKMGAHQRGSCNNTLLRRVSWNRSNRFSEYRVFLNLGFGEPMFCTTDSRGFRCFRGSANLAINLLVGGCLSCLHHFRDSRRFRGKHRIAKHRFGKT